MNFKFKGKEKVVLITTVALLACGGAGYMVHADNQYREQVTQALQETKVTKEALASIESEILSYYANDDKEFLVKDVTLTDVDDLKLSLKSLKRPSYEVKSDELTVEVTKNSKEKEHLESEFAALSQKLESQDQINSFFQKEKAIDGSSIKYDLVIVDDLNTEKLMTISENGSSEWVTSLKKILQNAINQLSDIEKSEKQIDLFFKDTKVVDKIDDKALKTAQDDVKKIRNDKARKKQEVRLKQVTDELSKRKTIEEKAKAEEAVKAFGGQVIEDSNGNIKIVDASGQELAKSGEGDNASWVPEVSPSDNSGSNTQGNGGTGQTTPPSGNNNNSSGGIPPVNPPAPPVSPPINPPVEPSAPTITSGYIGNSGMTFTEWGAMVAFARSQVDPIDAPYNGYDPITIYYSDGSVKYSIDFH